MTVATLGYILRTVERRVKPRGVAVYRSAQKIKPDLSEEVRLQAFRMS